MTPLFAQKQSRDRSFERLYRAHVQDVYRYALMVLRNPADAEDVAQTTFMKAYRAFQRGDRPRHARQWLITIAHNTCRTRLRDAKRRPHEVVLDERVVGTTSVRGEEQVDVPGLVKALEALSFNQRAALVMRELEGRTYAEIADVLNVSSTAVETLLFRARRALREQLEGPLTCGEAERALSLQLDGRLPADERGQLRAHLRECRECASLARRQRARRAALRSLGPLPLPASLVSWGGGAVGAGVAAKVAAVLAAGVVAVGAGSDVADAVSEPRLSRAEPAAAAAERVTPASMRSTLLPSHARSVRTDERPATDATTNAAVAGRTTIPNATSERAVPNVAEAQTPTETASTPALVPSVTNALPPAPAPPPVVVPPLPVEPPVALPPLPVEVPPLPLDVPTLPPPLPGLPSP
jgi:RNA polymerase sigma factor (sigma-70 family)